MADEDKKPEIEDSKDEAKSFSQDDVNKIVGDRVVNLNKELDELKKTVSSFAEKEKEAQEKIDLEAKAKMSEGEKADAALNAIEELKGQIKERDNLLLEKEAQGKVSLIDSKDSDALIADGAIPKYKEFLLSQLKANRKIDGDESYFVDENNALITKENAISAVRKDYPEMFGVNRSDGYKLPDGKPKTTSTASIADRVKNGEDADTVLREVAETARVGARQKIEKQRELHKSAAMNTQPTQ